MLGLGTLALLAAAGTIPARVPFNSNEGWNALHALDVLKGLPLYRFDGFANFPNYPPGYFFILAGLGAIFGDMVMAGRIVALVSLIVLGMLIAAIAGRLGADRNGAFLSGGLFVLFIALTASDYVAVNDPQLLAHVPQVFALYLLAGHNKRGAGRLMTALLLMLLGGLIKHNLAALPLAVTLWLALTDRRGLLIWVVSGAALLALMFGLAWLAFGPDIFAQILGHQRQLAFDQLFVSRNALVFVLPLAVIAALTTLGKRSRSGPKLLGLYLASALALGLFFATGRGVSVNAWFDLAIAALPLVGLAATHAAFGTLEWFRQGSGRRSVLAGLAVAGMLWTLPAASAYYRLRLDAYALAASIAPALGEMAKTDGVVACEDPTFCYWAGKANAVDFANATQRFRLDPEQRTAFLGMIEERRFAWLQIYRTSSIGLDPESIAVLEAHYVPKAMSTFYLYGPKP